MKSTNLVPNKYVYGMLPMKSNKHGLYRLKRLHRFMLYRRLMLYRRPPLQPKQKGMPLQHSLQLCKKPTGKRLIRKYTLENFYLETCHIP